MCSCSHVTSPSAQLTLPKNGGESDVEGAINGMIGSMVSVDMEQPQSPSEGQDENELDNPLFGGQTGVVSSLHKNAPPPPYRPKGS